LSSRDGKPISWFEIADADEGGFVKADAKAGWCIGVAVGGWREKSGGGAIRLGHAGRAEPRELGGASGIGVSCGSIPARDAVTKKCAELKDFKLVYDLDLSKLGR
jgi:hypothetical protein